jgi:RNA polymerase sigma-70 factor, ECF subfamily
VRHSVLKHVESPQKAHPTDQRTAPDTEGAVLVTMPMPPSAEAALLEGLLEGRAAAVAALYDRYATLVRRILVRTLGDARDVDDLAQDTFITVVRKCRSVRDATVLRSFIVSVAIRKARNEMRRRSIRRFVHLDDAPRTAVTPAHDAVVAEQIQRLYRALERLDADSRIAFVVRHVEGQTLAEAAEECGWSLATFKRRLAKAEARFERLCQQDPVLLGLSGDGNTDKEAP